MILLSFFSYFSSLIAHQPNQSVKNPILPEFSLCLSDCFLLKFINSFVCKLTLWPQHRLKWAPKLVVLSKCRKPALERLPDQKDKSTLQNFNLCKLEQHSSWPPQEDITKPLVASKLPPQISLSTDGANYKGHKNWQQISKLP